MCVQYIHIRSVRIGIFTWVHHMFEACTRLVQLDIYLGLPTYRRPVCIRQVQRDIYLGPPHVGGLYPPGPKGFPVSENL